MVNKVAPQYSNLAPDLVKSYSPTEDKIKTWHTVKRGHTESLDSIAKQYGVPEEKLVEFNFPGSVKAGRVDPDVVNWYLFNHMRTRCRDITRNGYNYMLSGGERIAIPYLGRVEVGEVTVLTPTNTRFKIRQLMNLSAALIGAADFSIFEIWDQKSTKCSCYTYWAGGVSKSLTPGFLSATLKGDWNELVTNKPMAVNQFTGATRFTTGGAGRFTVNYINFMDLPAGTHTIPNPLPLRTGTTIGAGAGTNIGKMTLMLLGTLNGLYPCTAP
jgi:hypothetical protein